MWMSAWIRSFFPFPSDRDHRCSAITSTLIFQQSLEENESSSDTPPLGSKAKGLMRCTGCLLYSRCDQRQLDAIIACQCPLARLVTLEEDWSLWRDPNSSVIDVTRSDQQNGNRLIFVDSSENNKAHYNCSINFKHLHTLPGMKTMIS